MQERRPNKKSTNFAMPKKFLQEEVIPLPRCLEELHLEQVVNQQFFIVSKIFFLGHSKLRILNYSDNCIVTLKGTVYLAIPHRRVITIYLSRNRCFNITKNFFQFSCMYYEKLFLSKNSLAQQLSLDTNGSLFEPCTQLTLLDLAENGIYHLIYFIS